MLRAFKRGWIKPPQREKQLTRVNPTYQTGPTSTGQMLSQEPDAIHYLDLIPLPPTLRSFPPHPYRHRRRRMAFLSRRSHHPTDQFDPGLHPSSAMC